MCFFFNANHIFFYIDEWLNLIEECLAHEVQAIREKAIEALPHMFEQYLQDDNLKYGEMTAKQKRMELVDKYCEQLSNTGVNGLVLRMGYSRAIGEVFIRLWVQKRVFLSFSWVL